MNAMIKKLLQGQAVEWQALGEVLVRTKGTKITAGKMKELHKSNAPIKIFAGGKTFALVDFDDIPQKDINHKPSIIVKSRGIIEFEYYDKPFSHKNEMWAYHSQNPNINIKFIYYFLKQNEPYFQKIGSKMQMPQIATPDTDKFKIPIPPLSVQSQIVQILDTFTELNDQLTAELSMRQKQYQYYRDLLLSEHELAKVGFEWKSLGEVAFFYGGLTGKSKHDFENGNAKYITYKNIFSNLEIQPNNLEMVKISDNERQHQVKYGDILFTGSSESPEEVGMSSAVTTKFDEPIYLNSFSFGIRFNDDIQITPEFAKYLFRSNIIRREIIRTANGVTRFNVSKERFKKIQIPIPPLSVQSQIVAILDTFDTLVNSICEGLPKEIKLRQTQYEYYREQLLNFKATI
ncbi:restriction endonuclease subunit S [Moraxella catarrhalis]|uniref:restriction endonuclease subunit S n=1 Tax=Moraxella catarrhalis TaxID=480 RepID=UPI0011C4C4A7|nr:restriction endonuclease subunit S [Moraxella catarrhalis]